MATKLVVLNLGLPKQPKISFTNFVNNSGNVIISNGVDLEIKIESSQENIAVQGESIY